MFFFFKFSQLSIFPHSAFLLVEGVHVDIHLTKAWTSIDWLSIIWISDLSDKIKQDFFQTVAASILQYGFTKWTQSKRIEKMEDRN